MMIDRQVEQDAVLYQNSAEHKCCSPIVKTQLAAKPGVLL